MSKHMHDQAGFIPLMLTILFVVLVILYFAWKYVAQAQR